MIAHSVLLIATSESQLEPLCLSVGAEAAMLSCLLPTPSCLVQKAANGMTISVYWEEGENNRCLCGLLGILCVECKLDGSIEAAILGTHPIKYNKTCFQVS